ncbi:hypothetical protein CRENBAI_005993 [Crenichthys baileyi]|uniref:Uncharacterized protein n=1 Tax=Crenichthys baileyi TaxID=28760 RepID=A0AAV9R935_9TELE
MQSEALRKIQTKAEAEISREGRRERKRVCLPPRASKKTRQGYPDLEIEVQEKLALQAFSWGHGPARLSEHICVHSLDSFSAVLAEVERVEPMLSIKNDSPGARLYAAQTSTESDEEEASLTNANLLLDGKYHAGGVGDDKEEWSAIYVENWVIWLVTVQLQFHVKETCCPL